MTETAEAHGIGDDIGHGADAGSAVADEKSGLVLAVARRAVGRQFCGELLTLSAAEKGYLLAFARIDGVRHCADIVDAFFVYFKDGIGGPYTGEESRIGIFRLFGAVTYDHYALGREFHAEWHTADI